MLNIKTKTIMETKFKGTQGEWKVKHLDDIFIESELGEQICEMPATGIIKYETWRENALLISKAPEMLDMLEDVKDYLGSDVREKVEQLIKSATEL